MVNVHSSAPGYRVPTLPSFLTPRWPADPSPAVVSVDFALTYDFPEEHIQHPESRAVWQTGDGALTERVSRGLATLDEIPVGGIRASFPTLIRQITRSRADTEGGGVTVFMGNCMFNAKMSVLR